MYSMNETSLKKLQDDLERLQIELANKERLIHEQEQTLSHFRKIYDQSSIVAQIGIWECTLPDEELTWSDYVYDIFELPKENLSRVLIHWHAIRRLQR